MKQYLAFALGRATNTLEEIAVDALEATFASKNHSFEELMLALIESPAFARRMEDN